MATSLSNPVTGRLLDGRYEVGRLVARGGMATVYEAVDTRLERTVAIKVMHPALAADAEFVSRFIREARSAARLSHPNVVAVYDQGTDGDAVYLAMEYVEGATLRDLLRMRGRLTPADALAIIEQVLGALAAAHKAGLVHRDVKPENVLLTEDGRVKVADFGLARAISSSVSTSTLTSGVIIGTVSYLSPEQVERGVADARSDVYATGIMLFEMLTGEKPYTGGTPMEVAFRHVHERVPAPSTRVEAIPRDVDTLVTRATARNPDDRPRDAAALLVEVRRVRDGRPTFMEPLVDDVEPTVRVDDLTRALDVHPARTAPPGQLVPRAAEKRRRADVETVTPAQSRSRHRRRRGWLAFVLVLLLGAVAATIGWWYAEGRFTTTPTITVGTAQADVRRVLAAADLTPSFEPAFDETVPEGLVVDTDPDPGERILTGGTVTVVLSKGPERFDVPDLRGLTPAAATAEVETQPLVLGQQIDEFSETVPAGEVIRSEPVAFFPLPRDGEVVLVVSKGREDFPVPTVVGKTLAEARSVLIAGGFSPVEDPTVFSGTVAAGSVVSQSPKDATGFRGTDVHVVVSKGPELFAVPDVFGMKQSVAEDILGAAGFRVEIENPFGTSVLFTVYNQNPVADTMLAKGSTVTLQIF